MTRIVVFIVQCKNIESANTNINYTQKRHCTSSQSPRILSGVNLASTTFLVQVDASDAKLPMIKKTSLS